MHSTSKQSTRPSRRHPAPWTPTSSRNPYPFAQGWPFGPCRAGCQYRAYPFNLETDLEGGDDDVGWVDTDGDGGGVRLLNVDSVDVDNPLLSVDLIN
jgi:hypothetical protein